MTYTLMTSLLAAMLVTTAAVAEPATSRSFYETATAASPEAR
jgi:hypothetical protein